MIPELFDNEDCDQLLKGKRKGRIK